MAELCTECGEVIYVGSKLLEDAYTEKDGTYTHVVCPPKCPVDPDKDRANGFCVWDGKPVPAEMKNKFFCSDWCRVCMNRWREAQNPRIDSDLEDC